MVDRFPELVLPSLPTEVQAYVINKRADLKDKTDYVDLDTQDVHSHRDYILRVTGQPYRNRQGVLVYNL